MTFYKDMQSVVTSVLSDFKQGEIKLLQLVNGTGDPDDPGQPTVTEHTLDAVCSGLSMKYIQQGFVASTDFLVTSAVLEGVTPTEDDFIQVDSIRCKIVRDMSVPAAGTKAAWKFIVRKGG